jgi:asparagine synthase (glutamine-hydrolysing)
MKPRVAGILSDNPQSVLEYLWLAAEHFASEHPGTAKSLCWPQEQPKLGVVIASGRRPSIEYWRDDDGSFSVLDGEIYNAEDLWTGPGPFQGLALGARLVLSLYRQGGAHGLARIDASAGIVVWDAGLRELLLFRDPEGAAPVFYAAPGGAFVFASEIMTLLHAGVPRTIDLKTLDYFLTKGYAPAPWTFVQGIRKLPPGHVLACRAGGPPRFSRFANRTTTPKHSYGAAARNEQIRDLMLHSLRRRRGSGRTAVLLSGGVDSALVLAGLVKLVGTQPDAFTFKYAEYSGPLNEEDLAGRVARHLAVRHETVLCRPADLADNLPRLLRDYGEPLSWGLHSFMLGSLTQCGVETLLTGIGPDTWNVFKLDRAGIWFRKRARYVRALARAGWMVGRPMLPRWVKSVTAILRTERNGLPPQIVFPSIMSADLRRKVYVDPRWLEEGEEAALALLLSNLDELADEDPYDQARLIDYRLFDAEALMFWNTAWARSADLDVRHPYYDRELQDFFFRFRGDVPGKQYLREFAATILPKDIAAAPKLPHAVPIGHWLRGPLRDLLLDHLSPESLCHSGLFSPAAVTRLVDAHLRGITDHSWRLWCLLATVVWHRAVLNGTVRVPHAHTAPISSEWEHRLCL